VRAALASAFLLLGCAQQSEAAPSLELGTGTFRFEPVEDGHGLPMIRGAQGGWHLWVAVRTHGIDAALGSLTIELQRADESDPPQTTTLGVQLDPPDDDGRRSYLGWPAILPDPSCSAGELFRVHASFTTSAGEQYEDERHAVALPGDDPPAPCAAISGP
jgi:hypothetical protein